MKHIRSGFFILLSLVLIQCGPEKRPEIQAEEYQATLMSTLQEFNTAFQTGDVDKLASMITSDYIHTNGSSKSFGKESWLKIFEKTE